MCPVKRQGRLWDGEEATPDSLPAEMSMAI